MSRGEGVRDKQAGEGRHEKKATLRRQNTVKWFVVVRKRKGEHYCYGGTE